MKKLVSIIKKMTLLALVAIAIIVCTSIAPAKAADTYVTEEQLARYYLIKAANWGLVESQTLEEFGPTKPATYQFTVDLVYSAVVLHTKGGFPEAKNHSFKKENKWLKGVIYSTACSEPEKASELFANFTNGKNRSPKKSDKISFGQLAAIVTILSDAQSEDWAEGLNNLKLEIEDRWQVLGEGNKVTRIEALDYVMNMLTDISTDVSEVIDYLIGPPMPPAEPTEMIGTAIMMTDDYEVYEDGVFIGIYDPKTDTINQIGEPPVAPEEEILGPAIMMTDNFEVYLDGEFYGIYDPETDTITPVKQ